MPSTPATKPATITFAGRPTDSNKGLVTFLDALRILTTTPQLPLFQAWIIGGSDREVREVAAIIGFDSALHDWLTSGRLTLWGRVDNDAIGVLLARSTAVVIPSLREQYGIVAVEAMMCGTPVIASRTGGLTDLVLPGLTGHHFEPDDVLALSAILTLYLRNPAWSERLGRGARLWAVHGFMQSDLMEEYVRAYHGEPVHELSAVARGTAFLNEIAGGHFEPPAARIAISFTSPPDAPNGDLAAAVAAVRRERSWEAVARADALAASPNADLTVELVRLALCLESRVWPVPLDIATRFIRFAELALGTLQVAESTASRAAALATLPVGSLAAAIGELSATLAESSLASGVAWLVVEAMNRAIGEFCTGSRNGLDGVHVFLHDACSLWAQRFIR